MNQTQHIINKEMHSITDTHFTSLTQLFAQLIAFCSLTMTSIDSIHWNYYLNQNNQTIITPFIRQLYWSSIDSTFSSLFFNPIKQLIVTWFFQLTMDPFLPHKCHSFWNITRRGDYSICLIMSPNSSFKSLWNNRQIRKWWQTSDWFLLLCDSGVGPKQYPTGASGVRHIESSIPDIRSVSPKCLIGTNLVLNNWLIFHF